MNRETLSYDDSSTQLAPPMGRSARARAAILQALQDLGDPAGASRIAEMLGGSGVHLQERSIRFHLLKMDREGLTTCLTKHDGRQITDSGRKELARYNVMQKVGFVAAKMDELGYRMSLSAEQDGTAPGTVIANITIINKNDLSRALHFMRPVFASALGMGDRIAIRLPGERIGDHEAPRDSAIISTVCGVTINGIFLKAGIPIISKFGGLVEMDHGTPKRIVELVEYTGTTVNPHKLFIGSGMTSVGKCAVSGSGVIGVSFREFPSVALEKARSLVHQLRRMNLNGVIMVGQPNRPVLDIPVGDGRTGMVVVDGLNPIAAACEAGIPVELHPLSGLEDCASFVPFKEVAPMGRRTNFID